MRSQEQQDKLDRLSQEPNIPEDVQTCWHEVARRAQSACAGNNGYGLLTLTIVVNESKAVMWLPPGIEKIEPARAAKEMEMSAETMLSLAILASNNGYGS